MKMGEGSQSLLGENNGDDSDSELSKNRYFHQHFHMFGLYSSLLMGHLSLALLGPSPDHPLTH